MVRLSSYQNFQRPEDKYKNYNSLDNKGDMSKKDTSIKSFESMKPEWREMCEYFKSYPD